MAGSKYILTEEYKKNVFKEKSWFLLVVFQNVCFFDLFQKWPWVLEEMTQQNNKTPSFGNTVILKSIYVHLLPKSNKLPRSLALYSNDHMKTLNKTWNKSTLSSQKQSLKKLAYFASFLFCRSNVYHYESKVMTFGKTYKILVMDQA